MEHTLILSRSKAEGDTRLASVCDVNDYRVSHLVVEMGWVDFDLDVPPSCPATSA